MSTINTVPQASTAIAAALEDSKDARSDLANDISIDIETLSTRFDAAILSIGAVAFDRNTGAIGEKLYVEVDVTSAMASGHVSGSTLEWWMQQDEKARQLFATPGKSHLAVALQQVAVFVRRHEGAKVWGNGATFDITILDHAYSRLGLLTPWEFWSIRDMRTIVEAATAMGFDKHSVPFEGTKHNAIDDAVHQAHVIARSWGVCRAPAAPIFRPTDDALRDQTLQERDRYHEVADELAAQIAAITQQGIGEHSSANCPWRNAMLAADEFIAQQFRDFLASPGLDAKKAAPERLCLSKFATLDDYIVAKAAQAAELVAANEQITDLIAIVAQQVAVPGKGEPVRYEMRMRAPNGNCGPWHSVDAATFAKFSANHDIGDGFANETRALYAQPAPELVAAPDLWQQGVLMAASIVVACHDMPVIAATILNELGALTADCSTMDEFDKTSLRKIQGELSGAIALRGLDCTCPGGDGSLAWPCPTHGPATSVGVAAEQMS